MRKLQLVEQNRLNRIRIPENLLFKTVFEDSQEAIFFLNAENFNIIDCNKKAIELFQAENKNELLGKNAFSLYNSEPVEFSKNYFIDELIKGHEFTQELRLKSLKNNPFWGKISQKTIEADFGKVVITRIQKILEFTNSSELLNSLIKQTSRVTGTEFFKELSRLLSTAFEAKYVILASIIDEENKLARSFEFWAGDGYGENFVFDLNGPNTNVLNGYVTYYHKMLPELFPSYKIFNELQVESYLGVPIFAKDGKVSGLIILLDDKPMTEKLNARNILSIFASRTGAELERIKFEDRIKKSTEKYINASYVNERLLQIMAHDLKNPFNSILGYSELLKLKLDTYSKEKIKEIVDIIDHSSRNCYTLLEGLTEWSTERNCLLHTRLRKINLFSIVTKVIELYNYTALRKNIKVINEIDPDFKLKGDSMMIMTIIRNLLSNAIKFSYQGGEIRISSVNKDKTAFISVEDNGTGMTKEDIEKMTEDSLISKPGTGNEKGHGLGIGLCREFIELHKGNISVESTQNSGTKITFSIPQK